MRMRIKWWWVKYVEMAHKRDIIGALWGMQIQINGTSINDTEFVAAWDVWHKYSQKPRIGFNFDLKGENPKCLKTRLQLRKRNICTGIVIVSGK